MVKILSKTVKAVQYPNKTIHQKEKTSCEDNFHRETWKNHLFHFTFIPLQGLLYRMSIRMSS